MASPLQKYRLHFLKYDATKPVVQQQTLAVRLQPNRILTIKKRNRKNVLVSLRWVLLFYVGALSSSSVLGNLDSKYRAKLNSYLYPVLQSPGRSRFVRCWHAKTDGWAASTFHSNCDGKGPTVTIVQVGSYIFGGYTDKSWGGMYRFRTALFAQRWCLAFSYGLEKTIQIRWVWTHIYIYIYNFFWNTEVNFSVLNNIRIRVDWA